MKKQLINLSFALLILSSIVLQSIHSFVHIREVFTEKSCHHKYAVNQTEISHQHHKFHHCFACEFTISDYVKADFKSFEISKKEVSTFYNASYSKEIIQNFKGSLFQLRAPPIFFV